MTRLLTITVALEEAELSAFLARMAERGAVAGFDGDDTSGDVVADPASLDTAGVPWIDGIHASTKGKTNTGLWRGAKGVTADQRKAAEDAWKASNATFHVPGSIAGVPGGVTLPNGVPPMSPVPPMNPAPALAMPGFTPPAAMPGFVPVAVSYNDIAGKYQALLNAGKITQEAVSNIYRELGIIDPNVLQTDEAARGKIMERLNAFG